MKFISNVNHFVKCTFVLIVFTVYLILGWCYEKITGKPLYDYEEDE